LSKESWSYSRLIVPVRVFAYSRFSRSALDEIYARQDRL
jgi:hypothetical protein